MASPKPTPQEALGGIVKPLLNELQVTLTGVIVSENQQILLKLDAVAARLIVLEGLIAGVKKTPVRSVQVKVAESQVAKTDNIVVVPTDEKKAFYAHKAVYFKDRFKKDPEYRARYVDNDLQERMNVDQLISSKQKDEQKLIAQATFCWNYFKTEKKEMIDLIEIEFKQAKEAHESANKQPQQNVEERTPPSTPVGEKAGQ